jgi:hypothetical protein
VSGGQQAGWAHIGGSDHAPRMGQAGFEHLSADAGIILRQLTVERRRVLDIRASPLAEHFVVDNHLAFD